MPYTRSTLKSAIQYMYVLYGKQQLCVVSTLTAPLQAVLCKFHSVFLTLEGKVLTCGHGTGGRLGHDSEQSVVVSMCACMCTCMSVLRYVGVLTLN